MSPAWGLPKEPDTVTELPPWRASPAHHRAVALGALGAVVSGSQIHMPRGRRIGGSS